MRIGHHMYPGAGRPVEHPGWNLKPPVRIRASPATAKNNAVRFVDPFVNGDPKTKPRMPRVQQFPELSSVGVLKLRCTTPTDRTRASTGSHQSNSQHAPIRGKTGTDSPYERGQVGEQVTDPSLNSFPRFLRRNYSVFSTARPLRSLVPNSFGIGCSNAAGPRTLSMAASSLSGEKIRVT
jgi:hypothetical protein